MADLNNIRVPSIRTTPDPSKTPDANDPNNYCMSCNFTFQRRSSYTQHLVNIHHMSRLRLSKLHYPKNMKPTIDILGLYCDTCTKTYDTKKSYILHLVKLHKMVLPNIYSEPGNFDPSSLYCKSYQIHLSRYHRIKSDQTKSTSSRVNRNEIPAIDEIDTFCTACNKIFVNRTTYKVHLYSIHDITLPIPSRRAPQINRDIIPDTNDKKNHCASCDKTYSRRTSYKRHLATVHDMRERNIKQEDQNEKLNIRSVQTD
ncbi:hypothetical protein MFLAVUS_003570 [Mucor flavus]|uniref:C2H2-type domain-containing protein n=1 Tax=Mucor flavus TaxID=439312 RepID=A0ABP9YTG2_9FUNG